MKRALPLLAALLLACGPLSAADYIVDFTRVEDFETLRPLVTGCKDYSAMELYRERMQAAKNLEEMRGVFVRTGLGMFNDCKDGISGPGITLVEQVSTGGGRYALPGHAVNTSLYARRLHPCSRRSRQSIAATPCTHRRPALA